MAGTAGSVAPVFHAEGYVATNIYDFYHAIIHNNKLYFCRQDGTIGHEPSGATDEYWFLSLDGTFADAASLGGETALQWQRKINVEKARIDQLIAMEEGSIVTDIEKELADIRVGSNGVTYEDAGTAVREQMAVRNVATTKVSELPDVKLPLDEVLEGIDAKTDEAFKAMEEKAKETIATIPSDYTTLSNEVTDLKGDLVKLDNGLSADINNAVISVYDYTTNTVGAYIGSSGNVSEGGTWEVTDYIELNTDYRYTYSGYVDYDSAKKAIFYDKDKSVIYSTIFVPSENENAELTIPKNALYVRFTLHHDIVESFRVNKINMYSVEQIKDEIEQAKLCSKVLRCLYNNEKNTSGILSATGVLGAVGTTAWAVTDKMEVNSKERFIYYGLNRNGYSSATSACYYDENDTFISSFIPLSGTNVLSVPTNASYIRFTLSVETVNDAETFNCIMTNFLTDYDIDGTQWNGLQWDAFGTSMSDTTFEMPWNLGGYTGKYPPYLSAMSGLVHVNHALGGSRISQSATADRDTILTRIRNANISNSKLITIEGFVNDWANGTPIGEITDTDDSTLYGALNLAIKSITDRNPNALIVVLTDSTGRAWTAPDGKTEYTNTALNYVKSSINMTQNQYNNAIVEYCNLVGIRCIDAGRKSEINEYHPQYIGDNLHHSELGGKQYAQTVWNELKNIYPLLT